MGYTVDITIGAPSAGLSWSLAQAEGDVEDDIRVLGGLQFGWTVPGGLWPAQPDVTACALALNLPQFSEAAIHYGQKLSVEVRADVDVIAAFYGRITDWKVTNRDPQRPGVTASLVAVDYTVDIAEEPSTPFADGDFPDFHEKTIASRIFDQLTGVADIDDIWTSGFSRFIWPDSIEFGKPVDASPFLAQLLAQAVNLAAGTRMILSPYVDATGDIAPAPVTGRSFTLDTISNDVDIDADPWILDAETIPTSSPSWSQAKGRIPKIIIGTGWAGDAANTVTAVIDDAGGSTVVTMTTNTSNEAEAQDTVDFYAVPVFDIWEISEFTIEVTAAGIEADVPLGLFPDWKAPEGDPARAACYNRRLRLLDVDSTRTPYGGDTVEGVLVGATCRIAGGRLALDVALRCPAADIGPTADYIHPADYGTAPLGGLGTT